MGRRAMLLMGLFLTQGRFAITFGDWRWYWGHLGVQSVINGFMHFVKQVHLEQQFCSHSQKRITKISNYCEPPLPQNIQVCEILLQFSNKWWIPLLLHVSLVATYLLSHFHAFSTPHFAQITNPFLEDPLSFQRCISKVLHISWILHLMFW